MFDELTKYYRSLAEANKHIGSFVGMDVNEFTSYAGEGAIQYPCLCMETLAGILSASRSDNPNTGATGGFAVLCAVDEGDYTAETPANGVRYRRADLRPDETGQERNADPGAPGNGY